MLKNGSLLMDIGGLATLKLLQVIHAAIFIFTMIHRRLRSTDQQFVIPVQEA